MVLHSYWPERLLLCTYYSPNVNSNEMGGFSRLLLPMFLVGTSNLDMGRRQVFLPLPAHSESELAESTELYFKVQRGK